MKNRQPPGIEPGASDFSTLVLSLDSLVPRLFGGGGKRAWYCVRMRVIAPTFHGLRTLSVHVRNTMTSLQGLEKMERPIAYALRRVGYPSMTLEPEQKDCVQCVYEGKDVFVWLPTEFGKTVCFEVFPFMFDMKLGRVDSLVVVVWPLVSHN